MTTIVTRAGKGSPLTNNEVDANFTNLNDAKIETLTSTDSSVTITGTGSSRDLSVPVNPNVVSGPASSTDNAVARFDGTTGKLIQNSVVTVDDTGNIAGAASLSNVDYVQVDTTGGSTQAVAKLQWDDGNGTLEFGLKGGNVNLQVGQEIVARVYNDSGSALTDGQIVYISGAQGNRIAVKLAKADSEATSAGTLGMVTESIASGAEGFITIMGTVNKLNTNGLTAGSLLYLSDTTAGAYTPTSPVAPNHRVTIGYVERVDNTVGSVYVKVDNGYELEELHNVKLTTPTGGQLLAYDEAAGYWKNVNLTDGTAISITETTAGAITIANTGVTSVTASTGISVSASTGGVTITNSAPDQTVALTAGTGISTSGTYPNFTITNSAPDQTVSIASGTGISVTGTYPNFTVASTVTGASISNDTTTNATRYPLYAAATSGTASTVYVSSTNYTYNPSTGTLSATVMSASSDERLKTNWSGLNADFVSKLADVKSGTFDRIDFGTRDVGVSAQSLQALLPQAVISDEEGYLSVNYGGAALVAAIELAKEVKALRAEIAELKAKG